MIKQIDTWAKREGVASRSEAIRRLVEQSLLAATQQPRRVATKAHPRQARGLVKKSAAASITCCLPKNGKDGSTSLRRAQKSFAMCETTSRNLRPKVIACVTMRWPQFLADPTYRNPSIWTWREWLT